MNLKKIIAVFVAVFCVVFLGKIGEDVKNETIVVNQYPLTGNMELPTNRSSSMVERNTDKVKIGVRFLSSVLI